MVVVVARVEMVTRWREEEVVVVVVEVVLEEDGGLVQQTEESEADRERDSSLREVRCEVTEERGEAPPPLWWGAITVL